MASVERALSKAAKALLPGLLQTPPVSTPSPCIIILPAASNPGRADVVERWDAHKNNDRPRSPASSCGSTSPGRADSCERWDMNKIKKINPISSSSTSSSSTSSRGSSMISGERYKRPPSRALGRAQEPTRRTSDAESQTGEEATSKEEDETTKMEETLPVFSGPTFVASPEPSMLPMPAFFARRAGINPLPAFVCSCRT
ncbi:hypothetical protein BRADI_4g42407v3 [Brachypodium distachyon]|uniref:Uncharacterized protein n=1 Tax=Brachypodium distachyon TaxID=15368 RepID=A0A2K2CTT7_BRADI|nr:hypothetical protein BRADI_4g42407v3 [Brachypodium distachyon]